MPASLTHISAGTPMGANLVAGGATFRVWAPRAQAVHLVSHGSGWQPSAANRLTPDAHGYWAGFWPGVVDGAEYKFYVIGPGGQGYKRDPYARELSNLPASFPNCNCVVRDASRYPWHDAAYRTPRFHDFIIYQLHVGAFWSPQGGQQAGKFLDVVQRLPYLGDLGVTAIQLLPIVEFNTTFSLGYNGTDYFSPENDFECSPAEVAARLPGINALLTAHGQPPLSASDMDGAANQLRCLVDLAHVHGLAVIFDVVYNHAGGDFGDESIYFFDRLPYGDNNDSLYFSDIGHAGGLCFALWRQEVRQFLIDNAKFLFQEFHADGLRHDQVSVLVEANRHDGWRFLQDLTGTCRAVRPGGLQHAEYWSVNPWVVKAASEGGAGFDTCYHDALRDAARRALEGAGGGAQAQVDMTGIAGALWPAGFDQSWKFVQNLETHDEVLEGRKPRIARLADGGNPRSWYARSRARVAAGLLLTSPGTPMLFMGQEFLEDKPWSDNVEARPNLRLYWAGLEGADRHMSDFHRCVRDLVHLRHRLPALRAEGFRVSHVHDDTRVLAFHRWVPAVGQDVVVVANLSESTHLDYQLGFPRPGRWEEAFNSDVYDNWVNPWRQGNGGAVIAA
ncbi:MAG TPA: alpha amylase C-terminal domain-containing protein, partial [Methylomirabilota bacterium]|nr:alpha amylase C-terminal domain-containing protein [Methylomirabilota bacterium]